MALPALIRVEAKISQIINLPTFAVERIDAREKSEQRLHAGETSTLHKMLSRGLWTARWRADTDSKRCYPQLPM